MYWDSGEKLPWRRSADFLYLCPWTALPFLGGERAPSASEPPSASGPPSASATLFIATLLRHRRPSSPVPKVAMNRRHRHLRHRRSTTDYMPRRLPLPLRGVRGRRASVVRGAGSCGSSPTNPKKTLLGHAASFRKLPFLFFCLGTASVLGNCLSFFIVYCSSPPSASAPFIARRGRPWTRRGRERPWTPPSSATCSYIFCAFLLNPYPHFRKFVVRFVSWK